MQSIHDKDAPRPFQCGDCDGEMVAKRGKVRTWHYAHKAQVVCEPKPDPDNALHQFAQDIIYENFLRHQADGTEYRVGVRCAGLSTDLGGYDVSNCNNPVAKNAAVPNAKIFKEHVLVPNTRSDLVIQLPDGKALILEVVNTHAPEESTRELYIDSGYPVLIQKVSWESLDELAEEFVTDEAFNVPAVRCDSCKSENRRMKEEFASRQEAHKKKKRIIDVAAQKLVRRRNTSLQFRPWYQVYKDSWGTGRPIQMYPKAQRPVFANAIILTELGFRQHNKSKRHLFSYQIRSNPSIVLYADLGGSEEVPIYKDASAMLYTFDIKEDPELMQYLIDRFGQILQKAGVNVRTGFESSAYIEQVGVTPERHVPKAMLDGLIRWDNTCKDCQAKVVYQGVCRQCGILQDSA